MVARIADVKTRLLCSTHFTVAQSLYRYRIVASNVVEASYGEDRAFMTELTSKPVQIVFSISHEDVFDRGTNGGLDFWEWNGSSWVFKLAW